ncbi:hypothetical protein, partial [Streptomyces hirsutus]|uniref:hypothetical protein n=1 Tax=Streptomyces hirsutus TaxID=35620 RepID=UPI003F4CC9BC
MHVGFLSSGRLKRYALGRGPRSMGVGSGFLPGVRLGVLGVGASDVRDASGGNSWGMAGYAGP